MESLIADYEHSGQELKITLTGEIDHQSAKSVRLEIDRSIYFYRAKDVVIDLSGVSFMDSSGLGLILGRYAHVKEAGGVLKVLDPSSGAERVLRLAGAESIIPIIRSESKTVR